MKENKFLDKVSIILDANMSELFLRVIDKIRKIEWGGLYEKE